MWENFQKALEKRVVKKRTIKDDKHLVMKICETVLVDCFGEVGKEFFQVKDYKNKTLLIKLKNSTWRNEFKLNDDRIKNEINKNLKENLIQKINLI